MHASDNNPKRTINSSFKKMKIVPLILLMILFPGFLLAQSFQKDDAGNPVVTQEFIDAELKQMEMESIPTDESFKLDQFNGKITVIDFWQTWCRPCLAGFKGFQKAKEQWPDQVEIIAASPDWADNKRKIRKFIKGKNYDFQFVWAGEIENKLDLKSIPYKIIIDPEGKLITSKSGTGGPDHEYKYIKDLIDEWYTSN